MSENTGILEKIEKQWAVFRKKNRNTDFIKFFKIYADY
jgi:hypothetical protein